MANNTNIDNHPNSSILSDPNTHTVSLSVAAKLVGVARSTATEAHIRTGCLMPGVPVIKIGRRCLVSTTHLRAALGIPEPLPSVAP
jgi:hypothetical protein